MGDKSMQGQSSTTHMNDYEKIRMKTFQENNKKFQDLGLKNYAKSLTSLVESDKTKKKKQTVTSEKDVEYLPGSDSNVDVEQDYHEKAIKRISKKAHPTRAKNSLWIVDSGCTRHITGNQELLDQHQSKKGSYIAFGDGGGWITGEGTVSNGLLSFDNVNYCEQLKYNLLGITQICDKSYTTMFDDKFCYSLKPGFQIPKEWIQMKAPRHNNIYI